MLVESNVWIESNVWVGSVHWAGFYDGVTVETEAILKYVCDTE